MNIYLSSYLSFTNPIYIILMKIPSIVSILPKPNAPWFDVKIASHPRKWFNHPNYSPITPDTELSVTCDSELDSQPIQPK